MIKGFIIGKFMPFHKGHEALIEYAKSKCDHLTVLVGFREGEPIPLKDVEVRRILGEVEERDGQEVMGTIFKTGDPIKVTDGPFVDFTGFVKEVDESKQKVKVEVSIFGRPTPVELDFLQIELEK